MSYRAVNVALYLVCAAVLLVLLGSLVVKARKSREDKLLMLVLLLNIVCFFSDAAAWGFNNKPELIYRILTGTGNFLMYIAGSCGYLLFMAYIMMGTAERTGKRVMPSGLLWGAMGALTALQLGIIVANLWNGMIYTVDAANHYRWGAWYFLPPLIMLLQLTLLNIQILRSRRMLESKTFWMFLSYGVLLFIALLFNIGYNRLMLAPPAGTIALLLIYVNVTQEQERRLQQQEQELADSRMAIMLSQIQPHFLFNALASIQDLCSRNLPQAEEAVRDFSIYLRGNLDSLTQKRAIRFEKELEHVRIYLALEKMRFEGRLTVAYEIEATEFTLPALTLQPIVENAVRYGVTKRVEGGKVVIRTREETACFCIVVEDDGVGFVSEAVPQDGRSHIGIANVRSRLAAMCGGTLAIESEPGCGTVAMITIPKGGRA